MAKFTLMPKSTAQEQNCEVCGREANCQMKYKTETTETFAFCCNNNDCREKAKILAAEKVK